MKITLRKRDSVTSAVLFIFNLLGEYKKDYTIKLEHLIKLLQYIDKSEASIRTGLSRMVKAKILVNKKIENEIIYELTKDGIQNIYKWNKGLERFYKRYSYRNSDWNKKWYFMNLFDFNKSDYKNNFMLEEFLELGLREFNNNIWITPYNIEEECIQLLDENKIKYLILSGSFESSIYLEETIKNIFQIDEIQGRYLDFINKINLDLTGIDDLKNGSIFPLLFNTGWDFYDIVTYDTVLPKEILNNWIGEKAVTQMRILRKELTNKALEYFRQNEII